MLPDVRNQHDPGDEFIVDIPICAYNHEKYIAQAIESVLMQRTNFPFRLLIGEDCSTDKTGEIVQEFAKKYPTIIYPIFHEKNVGASQNTIILFEHCIAKYIALLDGDDYWTDPYKLQKQVEFLDSHAEYVTCFHWADRLDEETGTITQKWWGPPEIKPFYTLDDLLEHCVFLPTCSVVFRNDVITTQNFPEFYEHVIMGDFVLHILLSRHGKIGFLDKPMAMYRVHEKGVCGGENNLLNFQRSIDLYTLVGNHFHITMRTSYRIGVAKLHFGAYNIYKSEGESFKALLAIYKVLKIAPNSMRRHLLGAGSIIQLMFPQLRNNIQFLRFVRIQGLRLLRRCCGEKMYRALKMWFHLLRGEKL